MERGVQKRGAQRCDKSIQEASTICPQARNERTWSARRRQLEQDLLEEPPSSSYKPWTPTSIGTTKSGSRSPLALSAPSTTKRALDLRH